MRAHATAAARTRWAVLHAQHGTARRAAEMPWPRSCARVPRSNLGLCCFYASQYDMALSCLDRALALASDNSGADVWYNIGQVAIGIGDLGLAYQAFKIAISVDSSHAESYTNLGVLELRKGNIDAARSNFRAVQTMAPHMFEPFFNGALLAYKLGDFQEVRSRQLRTQ